jgi:hypothetical protein
VSKKLGRHRYVLVSKGRVRNLIPDCNNSWNLQIGLLSIFSVVIPVLIPCLQLFRIFSCLRLLKVKKVSTRAFLTKKN